MRPGFLGIDFSDPAHLCGLCGLAVATGPTLFPWPARRAPQEPYVSIVMVGAE